MLSRRGSPWFSASRPSTYIRPRPIVSEFVVPVTEAVIWNANGVVGG